MTPSSTTPALSTTSSSNDIAPSHMLPLGSVIGLIGAGQLARMLAIAAELGFRTATNNQYRPHAYNGGLK